MTPINKNYLWQM